MPSGKSILLIDDSRNHGFFIERAFARLHTGISLFQLYSGEHALAYLSECPQRRPLPTLVLLDRDMPGGIDGFATLRAARALVTVEALPILMISGSDDPAHVDQARADGADGYAIKPVDQALYVDLARQVDAWTPVQSWRLTTSGKEIVRASCAVEAVAVRRVDSASVSMEPTFRASREARHLTQAAETAELPLALALNLRLNDHRLADKRQRFVRALMELGWTNPEVVLYLPVSKRYLEERRGEVARLACGDRARLLK